MDNKEPLAKLSPVKLRMMKPMKVRQQIMMALVMIFNIASLQAVEVAPRISDREIIESLAEIKAGQQAMQQRFEAIDQRFNDMEKRSEQRFNDMEKRSEQRFTAMEKQNDQRFTSIDQRFTAMEKQNDQRFNSIDHWKSFAEILACSPAVEADCVPAPGACFRSSGEAAQL